MVAARDITKLQYVAHDCAQAAGRVGASMAIRCDVTNERDVRELSTMVSAKYEQIDAVSFKGAHFKLSSRSRTS